MRPNVSIINEEHYSPCGWCMKRTEMSLCTAHNCQSIIENICVPVAVLLAPSFTIYLGWGIVSNIISWRGSFHTECVTTQSWKLNKYTVATKALTCSMRRGLAMQGAAAGGAVVLLLYCNTKSKAFVPRSHCLACSSSPWYRQAMDRINRFSVVLSLILYLLIFMTDLPQVTA